MSQNPTEREPGAAAPASRAGTPASSSSNRRIKDCTRCGKPASKKKCNRCLKHGLHVYYCSEACQQRHWKVHKKTCGPKYVGTLDALDQMTLDDAEGSSSQLGSFGDFESTELISISSGVDVHAVLPGSYSTWLHVASQKGEEEIVRALIAEGADVNKATICEQLATPMHFAAQSGHEAVIRALIEGGADFNSGDGIDGATPLHVAARGGCEVAARALIAAGAKIDKATRCGWTPLIAASNNGHTEIMRLLIEAGADINHSDENGVTALICAASRGLEATARVLIDEGADVNKAENHGYTPLDCASNLNHDAVARMLRVAGA